MKSTIVALITFCFLFIGPAYSKEKSKWIFGRIEQVTLLPENHSIMAKLDTGADMSSLSAIDVTKVENEKDGKEWIKFTVVNPQDKSRFTLLRPVERYTKIKNRKNKKAINLGRATQRPVIKIKVCIGRHRKIIPVNLVNRTQFKYPMLLGWRAIKQFHGLVDPSAKNITIPRCHEEVKAKIKV